MVLQRREKMKRFGLITVVLTTLLSTSLPMAVASPRDGMHAPRDGMHQMDRREKMERLEGFILEKVAQLDMERHAVLLELKETRPRAYRHLMMRFGKSLKMAAKDPGIETRFLRAIDLTSEMGTLADGFAELPRGQQSKRRVQMTEVATEMFELKMAGQRARLAAMEARLIKARGDLAKKEADKGDIVDEMVEKILSPKSDRKGPR
jgi:hypothetical protein